MESNKTITLKRLEGGLYHINPVYIVNIRTVINNGPYYTEVHISNFSDSTLNMGYPTILLVKESLAEVAIKIAQALTPEDFNADEVSSKKAEETILAEIKMVARAKATEAFSNTAKIDDTITAIMKSEAEKIIRNYIESKPVSFLDGIIENVISQVISNEICLQTLNESFTKKIIDNKIGMLLSKILFPEDPSKES